MAGAVMGAFNVEGIVKPLVSPVIERELGIVTPSPAAAALIKSLSSCRNMPVS
jgi:hypothetical protein